MFNALIVVVALATAGWLAFSGRLARSSGWKATLTPLASIMGSGFLVSAPLLGGTVGNLALVCMAALLVLAYGVGDAIRFNIRHFEPIENTENGAIQSVAFLSRIVLAGAYFVSVSYYLELLAAFVTDLAGVTSELAAPAITTSLLVVIGGLGMWRGLSELEGVERYTVSLNLGMIAALLMALGVYNFRLVVDGAWNLPDVASTIDGHGVRVLLGLLIVVQGFETSRYLGDDFPAEQRVYTMRTAQRVSAVIYLVFVASATVLFHDGLGADVTAILKMTRPVAIVLPVLLSIAAVGSQFSAAVADSSGAGGLIEELTHHRLPVRYAYLLILLITITLTWGTQVTQIIAYASRAFALYYTLQCVVAFSLAGRKSEISHRGLLRARFAVLAAICFAVFLLGVPAG